MAFVTTPLRTLPSFTQSFSKTSLRPSFACARRSYTPSITKPPTPKPTTMTPRMEFEISEGERFPLSLTVVALALVGWTVPASIPSKIPLLDGTGLTQAFLARVQANLAQFPKGPAMDDPFWVLMALWHLGLFAVLIFGTIGYNGRKSGLFKDVLPE